MDSFGESADAIQGDADLVQDAPVRKLGVRAFTRAVELGMGPIGIPL